MGEMCLKWFEVIIGCEAETCTVKSFVKADVMQGGAVLQSQLHVQR